MHLKWFVVVAVFLLIAADHVVVWQAFVRQARTAPTKARHTLWLRGALLMWVASALAVWSWIVSGVALSSVGFGAPQGWRLWVPLAATCVLAAWQASSAMKIARLSAPSEALRARLGSVEPIMPRKASELPAFVGVSLTAGFCEELLFRGFLIWAFQPDLGPWLASGLSAVVFGVAHAYQGVSGMVRTGLLGLAFTAIVLVTGSLWPAILLHAVLDVMGGVLGWLILRDVAPAPMTAGPPVRRLNASP